MKTLTHRTGARLVTESTLDSLTASGATRCRVRLAATTHTGIPTISTNWFDTDFGAMNQYPVHAFTKKHHSQRAKPT